MNKLSKKMIEHFNLVLEHEDSRLRYVITNIDGNVITYSLKVFDKYISTDNDCILNVTKEFENKVRSFFKEYDVENIGFSNTVVTIFAYQ